MSSKRLSLMLLGVIIVVYVAIAALYALLTPAWQVPDEPAHYNYVRALAEGRGLPVMEPGDYDQEYLALLTSQGFPPRLSLDAVAYEDHQPPLYYLLATPVFLLFGGALLPLRLFSVALGVALLVAVFGTLRAVFPSRPEVGLMATAFIAFIPQHVAMTAGVNNDVLGELAVAGTLWALVGYLRGKGERPWVLALLLAAACLTKVSAYVTVPLTVIAVVIRWRSEKRSWRWALSQLAWVLGPALLISAPWFVRNGLIYGWRDPLAQGRHTAVVEGQPLSSEWIALYGPGGLLRRFGRTTFQSFWGQFGWMGVVLPGYVYLALLLFSAFLGAAFLWWLFDRRRSGLEPLQRTTLRLFLLSAGLTLAILLVYNLTFVQHQGRYLFPALIPLGTAVALGLDKLAGVLPRWLRSWAIAALYLGMAALDVYCLFMAIVPSLAR